MNVNRIVPQRGLPTVGAWCFLDHFGPQRVHMQVDPHPHMGLQTVTWPLSGHIRHRDSLGSDVVLRPGELNLMTAGAGISHSEYSLTDAPGSSGEVEALQFWIALPDAARSVPASFAQHTQLPDLTLPALAGDHARVSVVMGSLAGVTSPAQTFSPLVGAQVVLAPASTVRIPLEPQWEHALVLLHGDVGITGDGGPVHPGVDDLAYLGSGAPTVEVSSATGATLFLFGGEPLDEQLVMWWNFVGRSHEDIVQAWNDWQFSVDLPGANARFGSVSGHGSDRIPAPPLPTVRLKPRGAPRRR